MHLHRIHCYMNISEVTFPTFKLWKVNLNEDQDTATSEPVIEKVMDVASPPDVTPKILYRDANGNLPPTDIEHEGEYINFIVLYLQSLLQSMYNAPVLPNHPTRLLFIFR